MNKSRKGKLQALSSHPVSALPILFILITVLSACSLGSYSEPVTQIIPVTQVIPITQVVPVTEVVPVPQVAPTAQIVTFSIPFTVFANQGWNVGILLPLNSQISVTYVSGSWTVNYWAGEKHYAGPDGYPGIYPSSIQGVCKQVPVPDALIGALVARLGSGPAFLIGSNDSFKSDLSEMLYFSINENDNCLEDNKGGISIKVDIAQ